MEILDKEILDDLTKDLFKLNNKIKIIMRNDLLKGTVKRFISLILDRNAPGWKITKKIFKINSDMITQIEVWIIDIQGYTIKDIFSNLNFIPPVIKGLSSIGYTFNYSNELKKTTIIFTANDLKGIENNNLFFDFRKKRINVQINMEENIF